MKGRLTISSWTVRTVHPTTLHSRVVRANAPALTRTTRVRSARQMTPTSAAVSRERAKYMTQSTHCSSWE